MGTKRAAASLAAVLLVASCAGEGPRTLAILNAPNGTVVSRDLRESFVVIDVDRSTAELMTRLYENLRLGVSTAEALQIAQRRTGERGSPLAHPFHWASFQVRGDWR